MFKKRLIASAVSIYTLGVVFGMFAFGDTFSSCAILVTLIVLSAIFLAVSARPNGFAVPKYITAIAIAVAVFSLGSLSVSINKNSLGKYAAFDGDNSEIVIQIVEVSENSLDGRIESCSAGVPKGTMIRFYPDNTEDFSFIIGDKLVTKSRYEYKERYNLYSQGIKITAYGSIVSKNDGDGIFYTVRKNVHESCDDLFGEFESAGAISKGITIGDRSSIDSYLFSVYRSSGLSHVLAISGFHISIIAMTLYGFLSCVGIKRTISVVLSIVVAAFYCALVGFNAGAVRAVIMLSFVLISQSFSRRGDSFTTLFIALFVLLIINPFSIYSAGFQLSFLCCLGILLVGPFVDSLKILISNHTRHERKIRSITKVMLEKVIEPLAISISAAVFSFPVICTRFDTVSCASPIVNVIAVPFFTIAIIFSIIAYICAPISITVAKIIAFPAGLLFDLVTDISQYIHDYEIGIISSHTELILLPFVFSLAMIASLIFLNKKRLLSFAICICLFCVSLVGCGVYNFVVYSDNEVVEYSNDGNEYVYTTARGGAYVDLGGYNSYPEVVFENGETSLGYYIMIDYSGGAYNRFEYLSGTLKVGKICLPKPENDYDVFILSSIKELAKQRNCDIILFDEYFSDVCPISVYGLDDNLLVCADVGGRKIRILGNGFKNAVDCDIAIVSNGYSGEEDLINADVIYASKEYSEYAKYKFYDEFNDRIRIEIDAKERDYRIYEP